MRAGRLPPGRRRWRLVGPTRLGSCALPTVAAWHRGVWASCIVCPRLSGTALRSLAARPLCAAPATAPWAATGWFSLFSPTERRFSVALCGVFPPPFVSECPAVLADVRLSYFHQCVVAGPKLANPAPPRRAPTARPPIGPCSGSMPRVCPRPGLRVTTACGCGSCVCGMCVCGREADGRVGDGSRHGHLGVRQDRLCGGEWFISARGDCGSGSSKSVRCRSLEVAANRPWRRGRGAGAPLSSGLLPLRGAGCTDAIGVSPADGEPSRRYLSGEGLSAPLSTPMGFA